MGHKEWHGFAYYDLIFPLFLFLAGLSFPFSLNKQYSVGKNRVDVSLKVMCRGLLLLLVGYMWDGVFPINKNLWTSSFACCAAGWSLLLFALFYFVVDVLGYVRWTLFFRVIGMSSITIYLTLHFLDFYKPIEAIFGGVLKMLPLIFYPFGYWLCYVLVC